MTAFIFILLLIATLIGLVLGIFRITEFFDEFEHYRRNPTERNREDCLEALHDILKAFIWPYGLFHYLYDTFTSKEETTLSQFFSLFKKGTPHK